MFSARFRKLREGNVEFLDTPAASDMASFAVTAPEPICIPTEATSPPIPKE